LEDAVVDVAHEAVEAELDVAWDCGPGVDGCAVDLVFALAGHGEEERGRGECACCVFGQEHEGERVHDERRIDDGELLEDASVGHRFAVLSRGQIPSICSPTAGPSHEATLDSDAMGLRITFLMPYLTVAGGCKTVGILGDALLARGHRVRIVHTALLPIPPIYRLRTFLRHVRTYLPELLQDKRVHVNGTKAELLPVWRPALRPEDVPDGDAVIATWWETVELLPRLSPAKGVPIHYVQGDEPFFVGGAYQSRAKAAFAGPFYPICVASFLHEIMTQRYGHRHGTVVPNGLEPRFDAPPRERNAKPTVGFVYSNLSLKGAAVAIRAIAEAEKQVGDIRVLSFGSSPPDGSIPLPRNFEFHHKPPQEEIPRLHARADLWLLPSTTEGFGLPGLEAAGCRCPVVATRCGGPSEYLRDGENGYLVDVGDVQGMARAIERILKLDPADWKAMSERSHSIARTFSWPKSAELFEKAIEHAIQVAR
jgi:glycosyltransferase involved in cell wall biosynthesis